ncbi:exonuclease domain-containing protein [Ornithobacterium rhinotracheale]
MKYAVLDIEATNGKRGEEKIIDIAIYQITDEEISDQFGSMVNPQREIEPYVQELTGITNKMVRRAPKFHEIAKRIVEITEGCIIVGHGVHFDYRMLQQEFKSLGYDFKRDTLDTLELSKQLIPDEESYSLGKLCKSLGIPLTNRHRAQGDTVATVKLFQLLREKDTEKKIIESQTQSGSEKAPTQLTKNLLALQKNLPTYAGVYYYHNQKGEIFYIKAAKNIAAEVNRDFASSLKEKQKIQRKVARISHEATGSFLIALLKINEEKKTHKKILNRKSNYFSYGLFIQKEKSSGMQSLEISTILKTRRSPLLLFSTRKKAFNALNDLSQKFKLTAEDSAKERSKKIKALKQFLDFPQRDFLIIDKGRNPQENTFVSIINNQLHHYGFFSLHNQLEDEKIREKLGISLHSNAINKALVKTFLYQSKSLKIKPLNNEKPK